MNDRLNARLNARLAGGLQYAVLGVLLALTPYAAMAEAADGSGPRLLEKVEQHGQNLQVKTSDGMYLFTPYAANMMQTAFVAHGEQFDPHSHAVIARPQQLHSVLRQADYGWQFDAGQLSVHIRRQPFGISYWYRGKLLVAEKQGFQSKQQARLIDFSISRDEALYGAGARALGMNRRGYRLPLYNKAHYGYEEHSEQMNFAMPLVYSSHRYALHFDNPQTGFLDLDSHGDNTLSFESSGGRQVYQLIAGADWPELMASYTRLTGHQPLPARWTLGNFASRFGYHSEAEARRMVALYQQEKIPLDAIIFDLYWFGKQMKGTMGNLTFEPEQFPDPKRMISDFSQQGVRTVLITEPFILSSSTRWQEAVQQQVLAKNPAGQPYQYDFYFGNTGLIDVFEPHARDWFWQQYRRLKQYGVAGWWGDLGEPEVHPADLQHASGSANQVHNIYGQEWARMIAEGYQRDYPQERPFILMRAGYSGAQRYGMVPWSGDVNRSWGGLRSQPEIALQMGMQGMAYMHSDLGGFASANLDDELYARWLQYGVFQPLFRPHAQEEVASEPVLRAAGARALAKAAIELRYALLPYNYTLAYQNHLNGMPLMRPLFFTEPDNRVLAGYSASYLWGDDLLVHPVLQPGQKQADLYFPSHADWFDWYTGAFHRGGTTASIALQDDHIPLFVRAGAIVPMSPGLQNTAQYDVRHLQLHYFYHAEAGSSHAMLYDDDGLTANADQLGAAASYGFSARAQAQGFSLQLSCQAGRQYRQQDKQWQLQVHGLASAPTSVKLNQRELPFEWDAEKKVLILQLDWPAGQGADLQVSLAR